jgi:23S rRNA pseudouridine2605 synthase
MLNKPPGYVTTRRDNLERPTVFDLLASNNNGLPMEPSWIFPVGRLDYNSVGLLLFTNVGALGEALTNPDSHVDKVYRVLLDHLPSPEALRRLEQGIQILAYLTRPCKIEIETLKSTEADIVNAETQKGAWVRVTLREGKNRQVRRMFAAVGCEVRQLIRICFGPLLLGDLPAGRWRELNDAEVRALHRSVNAPTTQSELIFHPLNRLNPFTNFL